MLKIFIVYLLTYLFVVCILVFLESFLKCDQALTISSFMLYITLAIVVETLLLQAIDVFSFECIQVQFLKTLHMLDVVVNDLIPTL